MKNSSAYERKLKNLLVRIRKLYSPGPATLPADPVTELIWSVLLEDAVEGSAKVGMSRLTTHFVDFNELRVSRFEEIIEALPNTLSEPKGRATRMTRALQAVYDKFDTLVIAELRDQSRREARNFVASIPEMTPFVEGRVCLFALGIHAMPVDRTLVSLLRDRGAVHPDTDPRDTQGFLERVVPAKDAVEVALLLEAFRQSPDKIPAEARASRSKPKAEKSAKKEKAPAKSKKAKKSK